MGYFRTRPFRELLQKCATIFVKHGRILQMKTRTACSLRSVWSVCVECRCVDESCWSDFRPGWCSCEPLADVLGPIPSKKGASLTSSSWQATDWVRLTWGFLGRVRNPGAVMGPGGNWNISLLNWNISHLNWNIYSLNWNISLLNWNIYYLNWNISLLNWNISLLNWSISLLNWNISL